MPKVKQEYIDKKREQIVDAAYRVCLRKPVEMVTISDVIEEAGLSQGGIYRYYKDLDEILADMLIFMRKEYNIIDRLESIMADENSTFEEITYRMCDTLAEAMEKHLFDIQKINFDLGVLTINEPDRGAKIVERAGHGGNMEYLEKVVIPKMIIGAVKSGLKPKGNPEEIGLYIASSLTGIEKFCILNTCYANGKPTAKVEPRVLFKMYAKTIILLAGGNAE